jgi:peptide/nickel transport system permease protein
VSTAVASAPAVATAPVSSRASAWSVVAAQLAKNRVAVGAGRSIQLLFVLAVAAPLVAFNVPIVLAAREGLSMPLLERLFDRFLFPGGVDVFFNLLLVCGPAWWLAGRVLRRTVARRAGAPPPPPASVRTTVVVLWLALLVVAAGLERGYLAGVLAFVVVPGVALLAATKLSTRPWARRRPLLPAFSTTAWFAVAFAAIVTIPGLYASRSLVDYRTRIEQGRADGSVSVAVMPLRPFHPSNVGEEGTASVARSLKAPDAVNWLGCDLNGQDVVARLVFGTRISMTIGIVAVSIYILIGTILGSLAGYYGRSVDMLISRSIEVMICFPTIFLLLTIVAVFDSRSIFLIMAAIGLVGWPGVARLVRGEFLRQRSLDYVTAARAQGISERRVIFGHVLPNCMGPILVSATLGIASSILVESGIAFLGLGDPSAASWGQMLTSGRETGKWHLILIPGGAIFFVVTVFNLFGEGLRDALDPKLRR